MVFRVYVEKKKTYRAEAESLRKDIEETLGITAQSLRIVNRYDVEGIREETFERAKALVFSEPQVDDILPFLPQSSHLFAVCFHPGQFDQRAESAKECIAFLSPEEDVEVRSAKVYAIDGVTDDEAQRIMAYVVNPVEARISSLDKPETLAMESACPSSVATLSGFTELGEKELSSLIPKYGLAMDKDDLTLFQEYFKSVGREPTITELKVCDTYWSDHCRHTTFMTEIEHATFHDAKAEKAWRLYHALREEIGDRKPVCLMDIATIGTKYLKRKGALLDLDQSEEINACSIARNAIIDGKEIPYLVLFKNETHNHPTEIEPFGGAATCIGGAIRDPLSGRAYVYQAMRISGCSDPTVPFEKTLAGKLPQKKLVVTAAKGNSSYGNQIGLATGFVDELYHEGYVAKHMELGAVVAAVPRENVRRERPQCGDVVILVGGRTGRDGIGGATGSSKSHLASSLSSSGAEVQKGNAPEERKLQRLFSDKQTALMIKRCNDFGAGGVSVAIGELADGLEIDLDAVPKKYLGLDGTEIAISESQERMAVVVGKEDAPKFLKKAEKENIEATIVAAVIDEPVLRMRWKGKRIVSLERKFLDLNGAPKRTRAVVEKPKEVRREEGKDLRLVLQNLRECSRQGLAERFDSTIGAGSVAMPFGGKYQKTPVQAMAALLPSQTGRSTTASLFSYGFNPYDTESNPFEGAYASVVESVAKLIASGSPMDGIYLTLQEYFGKPGTKPERWGKPLAALLGALSAQIDLSVAAIGGKDSMSGSFEHIDVPNTLVSFAINTVQADEVITPEFKKPGCRVTLVTPEGDIRQYFEKMAGIIRSGNVSAAATVPHHNVEAEIARMCFGNGIGYVSETHPSSVPAGSFILASDDVIPVGDEIGHTCERPFFDETPLEELLSSYERRLEDVYPQKTPKAEGVRTITKSGTRHAFTGTRTSRPVVLIPVFPGTNCECDSAKAWEDAGAKAEICIINTLSPELIRKSMDGFSCALDKAQILFLPGGFSGGDEPDGSGKFITSFLRGEKARESIRRLLSERDGLVGGICNGFQALVKLGLVPYGEIRDMDASCPDLTFNTLGRHVSRLVRTRVSSNSSPWLSKYAVGETQMVPVSHGEGRFIANDETLLALASRGQIATQYVDEHGIASGDIAFNPNGSMLAIEGITSPDGRIFGRMGHVERCQANLYRNVESSTSLKFFRGAVSYFA